MDIWTGNKNNCQKKAENMKNNTISSLLWDSGESFLSENEDYDLAYGPAKPKVYRGVSRIRKVA